VVVLLVSYSGRAQQAGAGAGQAQAAGQAATQAQSAGHAASVSQPQIASIRTQANLVLLDVVVTVGDGAIHGLGKDKFHVLDNGVPQQLTVFEEHNADAARAASLAAAKPPALGPNTYSDLPQSPEGNTANVLLLDALNTPVADQMNVRRQMLDYLKNIPAGTRIAVFTLASRLRMVEGFTTDASELAQALQTGKGGAAQQSAMLDQVFDQDVANSTSGMGNMGADPEAVASFQQFQADFASFETDLRVRMTLDALQGLARYLNPIPGRKNLIWFSGSFPLSIDPDSSQTEPFEAMRGYSQLVQATDGMLSAARVAVYPVDARGLMTDPSASVANDYESSVPPIGASGGGSSSVGGRGGRNLSQGRATNTSAGYAAITADNDFKTQTMKEHATMQQIAQETGGEAFVDSNGIKDAVASAVANGANYYTVGYVPSFKGYDGSYHRLKVTVDGPYKTAYRQGYFADDLGRSNAEGSQQLMTAALEQGAPPLSEILFMVRVQPVDATAKGAAPEAAAAGAGVDAGPKGAGVVSLKGPVKRYALDYGVPAHLLAFPAGEDGVRHARLEFTVVAYSLDGKRVNSVDQRADMDLKPALYAQVLQYGIPMHQEIDLPVGRLFVRVVVHDATSDRVGAIEVPVVVK
jgi:VWFA-related protein